MTAYKLASLVFTIVAAAVLFALAALGYTHREAVAQKLAAPECCSEQAEPCCPEQAPDSECGPGRTSVADTQKEAGNGS
jgi:hypothetical protein